MFKIGDFSRLSGLSIDTLYHYEKKGILIPAKIDKFTGYRSYDASQLTTVNKLLALKDAGFSLNEMAKFSNIELSALIKMLEEKAIEMEEKLNNE
jgi:DNA-binding transcriptional MerR regulator